MWNGEHHFVGGYNDFDDVLISSLVDVVSVIKY